MTADEANKLGVLPSERSSYFKTGASKSNLSPRSDDAPWYQLHSVTLPNPEPPSYMTGDRVQAVTRVQLSPTSMPPSGDDPKIRRAILDVVAAGKMIDGQCVPYSPNTSGVNNQRALIDDAVAAVKIATSPRTWQPQDISTVVFRTISALQSEGWLVNEV
ncbi:MAG: hypothetical protein WCG92_25015, partial [Hyphomicrobiales bacterium]